MSEGESAKAARNFELKVRCAETDVDDVRRRLVAIGASAAKRQRQIDTYFAVRHGRLKLRTITPVEGAPVAELIAYARPEVFGSRWSDYRRVPIGAIDAPDLERALAETIGVAVVVVKTREITIHGRTRIHLDLVDGLGAFVELETVLTDQTADEARAEHAATAELLSLDRFEPVAGSYRELMLALGAADDAEPKTKHDGEGSG